MTVARERVVRLDDGKPVKLPGETGRWLLQGEDKETGGLHFFFEVISPPDGSPPHMHEDADESFYAIVGGYDFELDGGKHNASPGSPVNGHRGVGHILLVNTCPRPDKSPCVARQGGAESWFGESGALIDGLRPPGRVKTRALATRHSVVGLRPQRGTLTADGAGRPGIPGGRAPGGVPAGVPTDRG